MLRGAVSHDHEEESIEAGDRWFRDLSLAGRRDLLGELADLAYRYFP